MLAERSDLESDSEGNRKRRGMLAEGGEQFWKSTLEGLDPRELESMLAQLGTEEEQGAAIEQLFGRRR